jgi:hypothetical protein
MLVKEAKEAARRWVHEEGAAVPGFGGAFLTGSASAPHGTAVTVVVDGEQQPPPPLRFSYEGFRLEVSYISSVRLQCAVSVLCDARLAGSFNTLNVLADPSGHLTELQERVAQEFASRRWVLVRCADAMDDVRAWLGRISARDSVAEQVLAWASGTGMTAHALLVAACRDPEVPHPYAAVREVLAERGRLDCHEVLLYLLGSAGLCRQRVETHLAGLERMLAALGESEEPRPYVVEGCRSLIERGLHREAVFEQVLAYAGGLVRLSNAGRDPASWESDFAALLADLGISSYEDRRRRADRVLAGLPELWQVAGSIMTDA